MSDTFPLSPGAAIAVAALITTHKHHMEHWEKWADDLRAWGEARLRSQVQEEEKP